MKAIINVFDKTNNNKRRPSMIKDAVDFYAWLGRAYERKSQVTPVDLRHIRIESERRIFEVTIAG